MFEIKFWKWGAKRGHQKFIADYKRVVIDKTVENIFFYLFISNWKWEETINVKKGHSKNLNI